MAKVEFNDKPELYSADLNPDFRAGETETRERPLTRTADEYKDLYAVLRDFTDDELKQIPVLVEGQRLEEGAVYIDLRDPKRGEFRGMNNMTAGPENRYVPKDEVDFDLWNRLIGVQNAYRLGRMA